MIRKPNFDQMVADVSGNTHLIYSQLYDALPVFGAELRAHFNSAGAITVVNGAVIPNIQIDSTPSLTADQAAQFALFDALLLAGEQATSESLQVVDATLDGLSHRPCPRRAGVNRLSLSRARQGWQPL